MKKVNFLFPIYILIVLFSFSSCKDDENSTKTINVVSQFVYDGLSTYYLWADEMISYKPAISDSVPGTYFDKLLNATDKSHGWSFITDDVDGLMAEFSGTPKEFGFSLIFAYANDAKTEYYAVVKYVFPGSPASAAGIGRNTIISKVNGNAITENNYMALYGTDPVTLTTLKFSGSTLITDKTVTLTPQTITTNPVLYTNIYETGGKKIAYLFYTGFINNFNNSLYETFNNFKQAGVTDLVLDLRYNHGGALTAATYLASLIAPRSAVVSNSTFVKLSYNVNLNAFFDQNKYSRSDSLGLYSPLESNPLNANLNLSKVYIIATDDSYSAAELTTFCLKQFMTVVHIGSNTGGKYTASWTLHAYDENLGVPIYDVNKLSSNDKTKLKNWAMQPIVAKYANKNDQDFSNPGYLVPDYPLQEGFGYLSAWTPIGDTNDVLLGEALYLITGDIKYKPVQKSAMKILPAASVITAKFKNPREPQSESVILDKKFTPAGLFKNP